MSIDSSDQVKTIWLLNAGIEVDKGATLDINSNDVDWIKIIPGKDTPNAISVYGSLNVDSVKITSWNTHTDDYVKLYKILENEEENEEEEQSSNELRHTSR